MDTCIFCKIITKEFSGLLVAETDEVSVFLSLENHPLVVPKKHIQNIYELDDATGAALMTELIKTAKAVKTAYQCDGVYITQANEPAAGQDVFHLHVHVYPRWHGKEMNVGERVPDDERLKSLEALTAIY